MASVVDPVVSAPHRASPLWAYTPVESPGYLRVWDFERFSLDYWRVWLGRNWNLSIYISIAYIVAIFLGQLYMKTRPRPFGLRPLLASWNIFLATFSILGTLRTWPEMYHILKTQQNGFHLSICSRDNHNMATAFWGLLFTLSKAIELGDTAFIVLRKQPLIFLHWYHHITVMGYTWYTYESYDATSRWFMVMNYPVHSLMYSYYALKSLRMGVPRGVSMLITLLQLSQMVMGVFINVYAWYVKSREGSEGACLVQSHHIHLALIMYASYFLLFANFFYAAYVKAKRQKQQQRRQELQDDKKRS